MQLSNTANPILLENEHIEEVNQFTYMGSIVSKDNATEKDTVSPVGFKRQGQHLYN